MSQIEVLSFIDQIFRESFHAFNTQVIIYTKDKQYDTSLITRNDKEILTFDKDKININDIINIKRK